MTSTLIRATPQNPGSASRPVGRNAHRGLWAVIITGLALFMASLDNLVVTTALPVIRVHLHAGLSSLEWTVNAYTLTFAVLLLTAAAFGTLMALEPALALIVGLVVLTQVPGPAAAVGICLVVAAGVGAARSGARAELPVPAQVGS